MATRKMPTKEKKYEGYPEVLNQKRSGTSEELVKLVVANCTILNVREKPTKDAKVLCVIHAGTVVLVKGMKDDWLHVSIFDDPAENRREGYILAQYTKEV